MERWQTGENFGGSGNCSSFTLNYLEQILHPQIVMQVNGLTILILIFVGILVGIGLYMPHYRHRSFVRFLFLGATTLYLPILSYVISNASTLASTLSNQPAESFPQMTFNDHGSMLLNCDADMHFSLIIFWVALAQIIGINTSTMVATDEREHRNNGLPVVLLAKAIWTTYMVVDIIISDIFGILLLIFALGFIKIVFKCLTFWIAQRSLANGRNPRLIVGYMMQLSQRSHNDAPTLEQQIVTTDEKSQESQQVEPTSDKKIDKTDEQSQEIIRHVPPTVEQHVEITYEQSHENSQHDKKFLPPPLMVMGDERQKIEKRPQGYCMKSIPSQDGETMVNMSLVTFDKIWRLDDKLIKSMPRIKDVCFSFALFKLLRCRFAGYTVDAAGFTQVHSFFWHEFLKGTKPERVFSVIEDELSFLHDYYYTSFPMSYSVTGMPIYNIFISLLVIMYCLFSPLLIFMETKLEDLSRFGQITCSIWCGDATGVTSLEKKDFGTVKMGSLLLDIVLVFLFLALVILAEARDIGSYIFSNWTNVVLICRHVTKHDTTQTPPTLYRWVRTMSELRCGLMKHMVDKMNQCSVLVIHHKHHPTVLLTRLMFFLRLGDRSKKVKVPLAVKAAIVNTLIRNNGVKSSGEAFLPSNNCIRDCCQKGAVHTILICHIATSLLELRRPKSATISDNEITSTHLSRYCAYLVSHMPELLPDDDRWCKSLYKAVKKQSLHLLSCGASRYEILVELLGNPVAHEVLQNGATLAARLVREHGGKEWNVLAEFWTEMVLHVASSGKPDNHAEAIAGGAELITLLWALVMHAGPGPTPTTAPESSTQTSSAEVVVTVAH